MDWQAVGLSVRLGFWTTAILLGIGLPLAYWLNFSKWRFKFLLEALIALPLVLPPSVLGFYVLMATGPNSTLGRIYETLTGGLLPFSFQGLLLGSVLYSLPFAVQPFMAGFSALDRQWIEAAWCLGASRTTTLFRVVLPICLPGILTGMILSFAHTLGEFGMVLMIGGNIPGVTRTVSVSIFDDVQALNYPEAGRASVLLLSVSFVVLVWVSFIRKRVGIRFSG